MARTITEELEMPTSPFAPKYDLVTGGSRGTGFETVLSLVRAGSEGVVFLYREKEKRAQKLIEEAALIDPSVSVVALKCDITDESQVQKVVDFLNERKAYLRSIFLVASGGLEPGMPEGYALLVNRDAQLTLVKKCWMYLTFGGKIIYDTSHWAHMHGWVEQLPGYEPIASSKSAGENALLELIPELENEKRRDAKFITVTADMLVDSMVVRGMERQSPGLITARLEVAGVEKLPLYATLGTANVDVLLDDKVRHRDVIVVGGSLDTLARLPIRVA